MNCLQMICDISSIERSEKDKDQAKKTDHILLTLISCDLFEILHTLVLKKQIKIVELAFWALGNFAGHSRFVAESLVKSSIFDVLKSSTGSNNLKIRCESIIAILNTLETLDPLHSLKLL